MKTDPSPSSAQPGILRVFQTRDQVRAYYNKIARFYDLLAERSEQPMREIGIAMLAPQSGETLLEIGFGTGHCLVELAGAVGPAGRVLGIDLAENMVGLTRKLVGDRGLEGRVALCSGDAASLPFPTGSVDGIFTSFTLELFDTPEIPTVLAECRRVLRPGGRLVVVAISKEGGEGPLLRAFEWTHRHFPNLMDCRPIFASRALEAAGFSVGETRIEQMWVPVEIVLGRTSPAGR